MITFNKRTRFFFFRSLVRLCFFSPRNSHPCSPSTKQSSLYRFVLLHLHLPRDLPLVLSGLPFRPVLATTFVSITVFSELPNIPLLVTSNLTKSKSTFSRIRLSRSPRRPCTSLQYFLVDRPSSTLGSNGTRHSAPLESSCSPFVIRRFSVVTLQVSSAHRILRLTSFHQSSTRFSHPTKTISSADIAHHGTSQYTFIVNSYITTGKKKQKYRPSAQNRYSVLTYSHPKIPCFSTYAFDASTFISTSNT